MSDAFITATFFIIFIPGVYVVYNLLKAFDYEKILRRGQIGQLKVLMVIVSIGLSFLLATAVVEMIERLTKFFV